MCNLCLLTVRGLVDIQGVCNLLQKDGRFSKQQTTVDELKDAFNVFDKSGDGMVSVQDLRYSLSGDGMVSVQDLMYSLSGDGTCIKTGSQVFTVT